jgi:hypothetical protein
VWSGDSALYYLRGSNSLWRFELGSPAGTEIFTVPGRAARGYGLIPCLSEDKTWLAWRWTSQTKEGLRNGTILFDLKNTEYRELNGWWYNIKWLVARADEN